ncbi:dehydrogenase/reductase SDR family protein 7-like [Asterias rubens]|uniref:dehydrogenase/reductase SDR family protein 7-like n=1 Tax=Asterias rubens TaxID=7604 RepID=UPI001455D67C|nr:dehydrogenase/reductase SDR family protein 7-like [Asterias rubens]XP_033631274.1 dehydrogenase/reductase SDR family protein 7-like [Asterias rubens]XP_033631275.1 dehydrogenase/reductase SDR family protein 7-like [Asterias rubens]
MESLRTSQLQLVAGIAFGSVGLLWLLRRLTLRRKISGLQGQVVLITGASSGLGEACAHAFYKAGSKVILCARRVNELERVKNELISLDLTTTTHPPHVLPLDLEDLEGIPAKAAKALALNDGGVDILINNGGMGFRGTVLETELSVQQKVMKVNYFGSVALTKALLPSMIAKGGGHIVALSSVQGKFAIPFRSAYAASKHAMQAFFECLRAEMAQHNVLVTIISPGYIRTNYSYNAVTADGTPHGEMDATIASGMSTDYVAERILHSIVKRQPDVIIGPLYLRMLIYIKAFLPSLYAWVMALRARGGRK